MKEGQVLSFNPFYFKNGNTAKKKYFLILKIVNGQTVIGSLPTRSNQAPSSIADKHGCFNDDSSCLNSYVFQAGKKICTNDFAFPITTFIYGHDVEDYSLRNFQDIYKIEGVDFEILGDLSPKELNAIIECIINSTSTKRIIKKFLRS